MGRVEITGLCPQGCGQSGEQANLQSWLRTILSSHLPAVMGKSLNTAVSHSSLMTSSYPSALQGLTPSYPLPKVKLTHYLPDSDHPFSIPSIRSALPNLLPDVLSPHPFLPPTSSPMGRTTPILPRLEWGEPHLLCGWTGHHSFPRVDLKAGRSLVGLGLVMDTESETTGHGPGPRAEPESGLLQMQELGTETRNLRKSCRPG